MRSMKSFFGFRKIQKKYLCMLAVLSLLSVVTVSTYAYFVISTQGYKASELLVAELSYGITIEEDGNTGSVINNNVVGVPAGKKAYFYVTVSSINKVDSKYTLAYKTTSNAVVQYTDRTPWISQGVIKGYDDNTYTKKIRVVIDNTQGSGAASVTFAVYGGYTFNTYAAISLGDSFYSVSGPYTETVAVKSSRLVDLVEEDTVCTTTSSESCLYAGGSINNYLQYPENDDKSKNLWRIMGTYEVGGSTVAKIVSESTATTTTANIGTSLTSFYNTLENVNQVIYKTSNFNCSASGCSTSSYSNIGLISTYEYEKIGGINSYLGRSSSYFAINGSAVNNITSVGIEATSSSTTSGLRPSVYLQTDIKVTGSGTVTDPYIISQRSDINLVAYTLNGAETDKTYSWLLSNKVVNNVTCEKGTNASWNYTNNTITLTNVQVPDYCTIDFKDGYTITMKATNGSVNAPTTAAVGHNGSTTFTVKPSTDYTLNGATVSCTTGASATINTTTGVVTVSNVTAAATCTAVLKPNKNALYTQILADKTTRPGKRTSFTSVLTTNNTKTLYTEDGNYTEGGKTVYYFAGNATDNWVYFGGFYWRIIRINEDNSVRLLYVGPDAATTSAFIVHNGTTMSGGSATTGMYNNTYNNTMYVGYMYGTTGSLANNRNNTVSSPIKTVIDNWYKDTLNASYNGYVSQTAIYCNDRSGDGYAASGTMYYAAYQRLINNKRPSYKCGNNNSGTLYGDNSNNDKFTVSTSTGNGKLTYPIALMTADEIAFAGGVYGTNAQAWYYYNSAGGSAVGSDYWWTLSPSYAYSSSDALVFRVLGSSNPGRLGTANVNSTNPGVRPVLSLKSCVLSSDDSADGSASKPYKVEITDSCKTATN